MSSDSIVLLKLAQKYPFLKKAAFLALGIDQEYNPLDVPLHAFDWRKATLTLHADPDVDTGEGEGEIEIELVAAKAPHAAVARGEDGQLILVRQGDVVLYHPDNGDYGVLKIASAG